MTKIYLASPYTHRNSGVRVSRYQKVFDFTIKLLKENYLVFSPIVYSHLLAERGHLDTKFNFWKKLDESMIDWCDELWVYTLPGWVDSFGVTSELAYAASKNKPIHLITEAFFDE